jgi:hypothetical protein
MSFGGGGEEVENIFINVMEKGSRRKHKGKVEVKKGKINLKRAKVKSKRVCSK